jgi:hypothetical protein
MLQKRRRSFRDERRFLLWVKFSNLILLQALLPQRRVLQPPDDFGYPDERYAYE